MAQLEAQKVPTSCVPCCAVTSAPTPMLDVACSQGKWVGGQKLCLARALELAVVLVSGSRGTAQSEERDSSGQVLSCQGPNQELRHYLCLGCPEVSPMEPGNNTQHVLESTLHADNTWSLRVQGRHRLPGRPTSQALTVSRWEQTAPETLP